MDGTIAIEPEAEAGWTGSSGAAGIQFAGRYRLLPDQRIPALDSPRAKAYAVADADKPANALFCLISPLEALPRLALARALVAQPIDGVLTPVAAGHCFWPPLGRAAAIFVFPRPRGGRLAPGAGGGLSSAELSRKLLEPIGRTLAAIDARGFTHRAIRADNLFWAGPEETEVLLGECVSSAAGADQPPLYEPLDRMTALPFGRGSGEAPDDLYALGVALIDLLYGLRSENGYSPAVLFRKLEQGTLSTLLPQVSPAPELANLLRGLLSDDAQRRWTPRHVSRWLAGERVDPPAPVAVLVAQRPILVGRGRFRTARSLAYGLSRLPDRAVALLRDGTIEQWLRVSLQDARLAAAVAQEVRDAESRPGARGYARSVLVERCCQIIDPDGPVRFGGISAMPESCGTLLGSMLLQAQEVDEIQAFLRSLAAGDLLAPSAAAQKPEMTSALNRAVKLLNGGAPVGGILRALYEMNPDLPCLSNLLPVPAADVRSLLEELDRRALDLPDGSPLTDDHVAAFLGSRLELDPAHAGGTAGAAPEAQRELRLLAQAQAYFGPSALPGLARSAAVRLSPVVRSIHNRAQRKRLAAAVAECVEKGDLATMVTRLDDGGLWNRDRAGFSRAQREFEACSRELHRLLDPARSGLSQALQEGRRIAAIVSLSMAVVIVCSVLAAS